MKRIPKMLLWSGLTMTGFAAQKLKSEPLFDPTGAAPKFEYVPLGARPKMRAQRHRFAPPRLPQPAPTTQFGDPLAQLTPDQLAAFVEGREEFGNVEDIDSGLGPIFNESSCVACHFSGATGGAGPNLVTRFGRVTNGQYDPLGARGGSLLQDKAIDPAALEIVPSEANVVAHRQSTPLFGLGLIEAIPDDAIERNAAPQRPDSPPRPTDPTRPGTPMPPVAPRDRRDGGNGPRDASYDGNLYPETGIHGRVSRVIDVVSGKSRVGRFGWKGQQATLLAFAGDAYLNEMGITNRFFPTENAPNGDLAKLAAFDHVADIEDEADESTGRSDIDAAADFMRYLAPPPQLPMSPSAGEGRRIFQSLNCAACHTPMMFTGPNAVAALDRKPVPLFSDLLLHDMGALGDGIAQADAKPYDFRTPPLWGLRASAPYLHDGRAATVDEAIRAHDGEAKNARERYLQLTPAQQQRLLDFLGTI